MITLLRTALAAALLTGLAIIAPAGVASASDGARPATCEYARYWTRGECGKARPTVTYRQGCAEERRNQPAMWRHDRFCHSLSGHRVRRGDTLWHIAKVWCGSGRQWRKIARANHVRGTRIYVGQRLTLPCVPK